MNKYVGRLSEEELTELIERYFDCETSEDEEVQLKCELSVTEYRNPVIEEAMATMGFFAATKPVVSKKKRRGAVIAWRVASAAAVMALMVTIGVHFMSNSGSIGEDYCLAYVNGMKVSNRAEVMALLQNELDDVSAVSSEESGDLSSRLSAFGVVMDEGFDE